MEMLAKKTSGGRWGTPLSASWTEQAYLGQHHCNPLLIVGVSKTANAGDPVSEKNSSRKLGGPLDHTEMLLRAETGLVHAVSYLPIRTEHRSCQLTGWPIPKRLPSLSLNQAALLKRLSSLSLTSAMPLTVLKPGKSYSSNTTPRPRSHSTVASMSSTSHPI